MTRTSPSLLIVTVNWNCGQMIADCIQSFVECDRPGDFRMVVVDNGSVDGSEAVVDELAAAGHPVSLVRAGENLGFGRACNLGVATAREAGFAPDFILFLNPDARLATDTFTRLFAAPCVQDPTIGIIGVQIKDETGLTWSCSYFPTALNFWCKGTGLDRLLRNQSWAQHHMHDFDHKAARAVDQVLGAFLMIRAELFAQLDGFDPQFFVYFEEVDLCLRAQKAGFRVWFEPASAIWHEGNGATQSVKGFRLYLSLSSRLRYFRKNTSRISLSSVIVLSFLVEPLARGVLALARGRIGDLKGLAEGYGLLLSKGIK